MKLLYSLAFVVALLGPLKASAAQDVGAQTVPLAMPRPSAPPKRSVPIEDPTAPVASAPPAVGGPVKQTKAEAKLEAKIQKQIDQATANGFALQTAWLAGRDTFNLRKVYLLNDGRACFIFDIGFAPLTALSKGSTVIQSSDGTGAAEFIDSTCTENGRLRAGQDITYRVLAHLPKPSRLADAR